MKALIKKTGYFILVILISSVLSFAYDFFKNKYNHSQEVSFMTPGQIQSTSHLPKRTVHFPSNWQGEYYLLTYEVPSTFQVGDILEVTPPSYSGMFWGRNRRWFMLSVTSKEGVSQIYAFNMNQVLPTDTLRVKLRITGNTIPTVAERSGDFFRLEEHYSCEVL